MNCLLKQVKHLSNAKTLTIILFPPIILFSRMDFKNEIIQWNCRGLKPNYNDVSLLFSEYNPAVFCFQEKFLKPENNISLKGFNIYNYVHTDCLRPSGGASIFVKSSFPQRKVDLHTELQATVVSVTLESRQRNNHMFCIYSPILFSQLPTLGQFTATTSVSVYHIR